ncbi:MAG TPA: GGDEF domain-containing protein [Candidatus Limnocylindrales bacterium]|jgi:diguanylate cyclase (GGDEF)-like protein|nr:GGDEF domain-containing protein [Candidatus Limnocylindrales bacterium]
MDRVLLQVKKKRDRRRLEDWLAKAYQIVFPDQENPLKGEFDVVIIDGPSLKNLRARVRERREAEQPVLLPFLLLTVRRRGSMPSRHLGPVVDDVIVRPLNEQELLARVANLLRMRRWSLELKKEHDRVMKLAVTDDVSGFNNTRYLHRYLDRLLDGAGKPGKVCLVFFDIDNFKHVVDTHGHLLGSKALREVAQTVARVLQEDDRLVRYGGDEFIAILPRQSKEEALLKVSRMKQAITSTRFLQKEGVNAHLTASFGLASFPDDARDKRELLAEADRCLFQSKTSGKNRITFAELQKAA